LNAFALAVGFGAVTAVLTVRIMPRVARDEG
jgi:hypothetical protein